MTGPASPRPDAPFRGPLLRALCLLCVLLVAKGALMALRAADGAPWAGSGPARALFPLALCAEDALLVLLWGGAEAAALLLFRPGRGLLAWVLYGAAALYVAANVPVARVFATPLTFPILRAAGGALSDSLAVYVTAGNVLAVLLVLLTALLLPPLLRRLIGPGPRAALGMTLALALPLGALAALGPAARARVETRGLHRNALLTLARTTLQQRAGAARADIEVPPLPSLEGPWPAGPPEGAGLAGLAGKAAGRSVLWVVLESTAAQYLRPYGAAEDPMPRLSALARDGLVFENAYAAYPESIKGLFGSLCAMHPAPHTPAERYAGARLPCDGLPERYAAAGYRTALFHSGWFLYLGMDGIVRDRGFAVRKDAGALGGAYATSFGVDEGATVRAVLDFLDGLAPGERFFVMYLPITGHHPYESPGPPDRPRPFHGGTELNRYRDDLYQGDRALGALLDGLKGRGLFQRLVLVVSGDHGEAFQQHEGNFGHTLALYEENVRVPLLLVAPGLIGPGRAAQVASLIDVAPTLLALSGLEVPARYQGRSLLSGGAGVARFLIDHTQAQMGLRQGRWKFVHEEESGRARLFDLLRDPGEREDLAAAHPERVARYRDHLRAFYTRQRALINDQERLIAR